MYEMMFIRCNLLIIFLLIGFCVVYLNAEWRLIVTNDGPTILDSNITFTAYLEGEGEGKDDEERTFIFKDNTHVTKEVLLRGDRNVSHIIKCDEDKYKPGVFIMTVKLLERKYHKLSNNTIFNLTEFVPVYIVFHQDGLPPEHTCSDCIASNKEVNLTAVIHDPPGYFNNSVNFFIWNIKGVPSVRGDSAIANFTAGTQRVGVQVLYVIHGKPKLGSFERILDVKDPVGDLNITGNLVLQHGQIFSIYVTCNGSAPFQYCFRLFKPNDSLEDMSCTDITTTTTCLASYRQYLPIVGNYHLYVYLRNDVNIKNKTVAVGILEISRTPLLSTFIIPIVCSIIVIIIIAAGIVYHIYYRNMYSVEVADFDFQQEHDFIKEEEEWVERTVCQHICDTIKKTFSHKFPCSRYSESEISPILNSNSAS